MDITADGSTVLVRNTVNDTCLKRHPNDLKLFKGDFATSTDINIQETAILSTWRKAFEEMGTRWGEEHNHVEEAPDGREQDQPTATLRSSTRVTMQNPRIYEDFDTTQLNGTHPNP